MKMECTGSPNEFALKLDISERMLFYYLEFLKQQGAKIKYSRIQQSYYYLEEFKLVII